MLRPWQGDKHTHAGSGATIEKPLRWDMINPHHVEADLAHQCQIGIDLFRSSEIISLCVRFERSVGNPFNKKFSGRLRKRISQLAESAGLLSLSCQAEAPAAAGSKYSGSRIRDSSTSLGMTNYKCCGAERFTFPKKRTVFSYSVSNASRITAPVHSMFSCVCAVEINPVSNCDGAK